VAISLDSCSDAIYKRIRLNANFKQTKKNIIHLAELRNHHPVKTFPLIANFVIQELNYREIPDFIDFCAQMELIPNFSYIWENQMAKNRALENHLEFGRFPASLKKLYKCLEAGMQKAETIGNPEIIKKTNEAKYYLDLLLREGILNRKKILDD